MNKLPVIITTGRSMTSLKKYFKIFDAELPEKLPAKVKDWPQATYDAPDGFLEVWDDGVWRAEFCMSSLASHQDEIPDHKALAEAIRQAVPGVTVRIEN